MARLRDGDRIGPFVVEGCIGQGQFGITYLARHRELGMKAAIKEFFPSSLARRSEDGTVSAADKPSSVQFGKERGEFLAEAQAIARFGDHPNIVKVKDFIAANGTSYIVMEWLDGETIAEKVGSRRGGDLQPYTVEALKPILLQLLDALETLHEAKPPLLHRDIKPANIIISNKTGAPVLIDFGAARQVSADRSQNLTAILTHGYAPYEQYTLADDEMEEAFDVDARRLGALPSQGPYTDIYALGAVCHFALTGSRPPDSLRRKGGDAIYQTLEGRVKGPPAFLRAVDRALAVEPRDRFASAREWRTAMEAVAEERLPPPPPPPPSRKLWLIAAIVGSAILISLVIWSIGGGGVRIRLVNDRNLPVTSLHAMALDGPNDNRAKGVTLDAGASTYITIPMKPGDCNAYISADWSDGRNSYGWYDICATTTIRLTDAMAGVETTTAPETTTTAPEATTTTTTVQPKTTAPVTVATIPLRNARSSRLTELYVADRKAVIEGTWGNNLVQGAPIEPAGTYELTIKRGGGYDCEFHFFGAWEDGVPLNQTATVNLCEHDSVTVQALP